MQRLLKAYLFALALSCALACTCVQNMCTNVPRDGKYYLTSFCDKEVACGRWSGNCNEYFAADYKRFGCGRVITCKRAGKAINLKVIDGGPGCDVERKANMPIIDASPSTCRYLANSNSCGWSDRIAITCAPGSLFLAYNETATDMLGPCSIDLDAAARNGLPLCVGDFSGPDVISME